MSPPGSLVCQVLCKLEIAQYMSSLSELYITDWKSNTAVGLL